MPALTTGEIEMLRRLAFLLLSAALLLSNIGCSSAQNSKNNNDSGNNKQPPITQAPDSSGGFASNKTLRFIVLADSRGSDNGVNSAIVKKICKKLNRFLHSLSLLLCRET